jgi:cytochrome c556
MRRATPSGALATLLIACAPSAQVRYEERVQAAPPAAIHAVHAERMAELMRGLERLSADRLPKAMDPQQEREWRVREVESAADGIADSAARIPGVAPESMRNGTDARTFRENAAVLELRARSLADEADTLTPEELRVRAEELQEACIACHRDFRPGVVDSDTSGAQP